MQQGQVSELGGIHAGGEVAQFLIVCHSDAVVAERLLLRCAQEFIGAGGTGGRVFIAQGVESGQIVHGLHPHILHQIGCVALLPDQRDDLIGPDQRHGELPVAAAGAVVAPLSEGIALRCVHGQLTEQAVLTAAGAVEGLVLHRAQEHGAVRRHRGHPVLVGGGGMETG